MSRARGSTHESLLALWLCALPLAVALPAAAVPANQAIELKAAGVRFEKAPFGEVSAASEVLVDDASVVTAQLQRSGEVLIEAKKSGSAQVFIFGKREVQVVRVVVLPRPAENLGAPPPAGVTEKERAACLAEATPEAPILIASAACYAVQRERLAVMSDSNLPRLVFELEGLQAEAKAAQALLDKAGLAQVQIGLSPFGIKLTGAKDEEEKRRALVALYPAVLGPLRLDE